MASILEIAKKSQEYIDNLNDNIDRVINSPEIEDQLTELNRKQLLMSVGNDGAPLIHQMTGSTRLSPAYAKRTGKQYPNIFLSGAYQKEMFTDSEYGKKIYRQSSFNHLVKYLPDNYPNLHGVNKMNQPIAQSITSKAIAEDYNNKVLT
jgi:hypothetical protein